MWILVCQNKTTFIWQVHPFMYCKGRPKATFPCIGYWILQSKLYMSDFFPNKVLCFFPAPATIVRHFLIIICVGKSFCCHCQSLTAATIGSDRWKRQINSRLILEFEVLPSWHEQTAFFKSAYFTGNVASPGRWTN